MHRYVDTSRNGPAERTAEKEFQTRNQATPTCLDRLDGFRRPAEGFARDDDRRDGRPGSTRAVLPGPSRTLLGAYVVRRRGTIGSCTYPTRPGPV
ncbi:hypothetical protein KNE206_75780 [Kitasatospora sp. NE20-6]